MNYFEEDYLHIKTEESIAIMQWLGLAKTEAYRTGWENFAKLIEQQHQLHWLFDFSDGKVIDIQDQKWTSDEWVPSTVGFLETNAKKLQKVAVILSKDIFNKVAVRVIMGSIEKNSGAEIAYFDSEGDALEWLQTSGHHIPVPEHQTGHPPPVQEYQQQTYTQTGYHTTHQTSTPTEYTTQPQSNTGQSDGFDDLDNFELMDDADLLE